MSDLETKSLSSLETADSLSDGDKILIERDGDMVKIDASNVGGGTSDWDENDEESQNYISNRTHYKEKVEINVVPETTITKDMLVNNQCVVSSEYALSPDEIIIVVFNGDENYIEALLDENYGVVYAEDTLSRFVLYSPPNSLEIRFSLLDPSIDEATISVSGNFTVYHKLSNDYLDGRLFKSGTANGSEIFNNYNDNTASGDYSHAEGNYTTASGKYAHAEGDHTTASGNYSHAEGSNTIAEDSSSHAEGYHATARNGGHAEGYYTVVNGSNSHAEGSNTIANGHYQHVEGAYNKIDNENKYIHIAGNGWEEDVDVRSNAYTLDWSGNGWYAGKLTVGSQPTENMDVATKKYVDDNAASSTTPDWDVNDPSAPGYIANRTHYKGSATNIKVIDYGNSLNCEEIFIEGTTTYNDITYTKRVDIPYYSCGNDKKYYKDDMVHFNKEVNTVQIELNNVSYTLNVQIEEGDGYDTIYLYDSNLYIEMSVCEESEDDIEASFDIYKLFYNNDFINVGDKLKLFIPVVENIYEYEKINNKYLEGTIIKNGVGTYSEIFNSPSNIAIGDCSHAEGMDTKAIGYYSHAEGWRTTASGQYSHAEGIDTTASGQSSHAEGEDTTASEWGSHAEGINTTASGDGSHAEGHHTTASGQHSHAEGYWTVAQRESQHVFGEYNILDTDGAGVTSKGKYVEIIGNGNYSKRSNARTLDWNGNESIAGNLTIGLGTADEVTITPAQLKQLLALLNN